MRIIRTFLGNRLSQGMTQREYEIRYHQVRVVDKSPCECCGEAVSKIGKNQHLKTAACNKHLMMYVNQVLDILSMGSTILNIEYIRNILQKITDYNVERCVKFIIFENKMNRIERETRYNKRCLLNELKPILERKKILMEMKIFLDQTKKEIEINKNKKWSEFRKIK